MSKRRPSGDGMVRKRDDGRWEGRIVVGHKENGDSIFRYVYAPTQKELSAKLRQHIDSYQGVDLTEQSRVILSEWLDQWLAGMADTLRPNTLRNYRSHIENHIRPGLGGKQLARITPKDVQKFYEKAGSGLSSSSAHKIHITLHGVFHQAMDAAVRERLTARNPTEGVTLPKKKSSAKQILNDEQLERFMEEIKKDPVWYDFFYTELTTGMRRGEICGLMWSDFDGKKGTLTVRRTLHQRKGGGLTTGETKTGKGRRTITLPPSTAQLLRNRRKGSCSQWIFPNPLRPEDPVNPGRACSRLKTLLKSAGLPGIRFHDLRHTFATMSLENGMDVKTLYAIIGHVSSATTLNIYTHITDEMQRNAARNIDQGIAGAEVEEEPEREEVAPPVNFMPYRPPHRRPGTGCVSQISDHLFEGRYSPKWIDGKKYARNIYAHTREECEKKLAVLIVQMKRELAELKAAQAAEMLSKH